MKRLLLLALLCGLLLAAASPVFAQAAQQAQLRITVVDQTGASIPMARVRVTPTGRHAGGRGRRTIAGRRR